MEYCSLQKILQVLKLMFFEADLEGCVEVYVKFKQFIKKDWIYNEICANP